MSEIKKDILHPDGQLEVDIYPKTSIDQVEGLSTELDLVQEINTKVDGKLDSVNVIGDFLLVAPKTGTTPTVKYFSDYVEGNAIVMRNADGKIKMGDAIQSDDGINLGQVQYLLSQVSTKLYYHRIGLTSTTYGNIFLSFVNTDSTPITTWSSIIGIFGGQPTNMSINLPNGLQGIGRIYISDPSINYKYVTITNDGVVQGGFSGYLTTGNFAVSDSVRSL